MIDDARAHLEAVTAGRAGLRTAGTPGQVWMKAIDGLLATAPDRRYDPLLPRLAEAFPKSEFFAFLAEIARQTANLPPAGFVDDLTADVQWVERPGSDRAVLLVCGHAHRLGVHPALLHRWMAGLDAHLIYVRDFSLRYYVTGIRSLGAYDATIKALRTRLAAAGVRRLVSYGNSGGVYGALRLGVDLGADGVVGIAGPTNLDPLFLDANGLDTAIDSLIPDHFDRVVDLGEALLRHSSPPRVAMWYGKDSRPDRLQAENLARCPSAELTAVEGYGQHNLFRELVMRGRFGDVLDWMRARLSNSGETAAGPTGAEG